MRKFDYDFIVVGSGTCGATIARELSKHNKKVLLLEKGKNRPPKESFFSMLPAVKIVKLGDNLMTMSATITGGSTALYLAVADLPSLDIFMSLGIDLSAELDKVRDELTITELPDELISPQTSRLHEAAWRLGYHGEKKLMFLDLSKCANGYSYEAKWKARSFVDEAVTNGATLVNNASVTRVLIENKKAVGVEYRVSKRNSTRVYGEKIVIAAGVAETPIILRNSGVKNIDDNGFFIDPNCGLFGTIPDMKGTNSFSGCWGLTYNDDIVLGDLNGTKSFFKLLMLANSKPELFFSHSTTIGIGVKVKDKQDGTLRENNTYYKKLTEDDYRNLKIGENVAREILLSAGAKNIFCSAYGATNLGGTLTIHKQVDERLETEYANLFVCDGSLMPENARVSPNLTLLCLAKYLSKILLCN